MTRTITAALAVLALAGCAAPTAGTGTAEPSVTVTVTVSPAAPPPASKATTAKASTATKPAATKAAALADNGWTVVGPVKLALGSLSTATVRIRNDGDGTRSSLFTITYVGTDGSVLASFTGAGNDVAAGKTVTVTMLTSETLKTTPKGTVEFQSS